MEQDSEIDKLSGALDKALHKAEAAAQKAKTAASDLKLARDAVNVFKGEYSTHPDAPLDLTVLNDDLSHYLQASGIDEQLLYSSNTASTTMSSISAFVATADTQPDSFIETKRFLESHDMQIQTRHDALRDRLTKISPHLGTMLDGAKASIQDTSNTLRSANVANNLRELHRELLEHLAPDDALKKARWFKHDKTSKSGVTRRHRLTYSVYGYVLPEAFPSDFTTIVDTHIGSLLKTVEDLSKVTHTTTSTLAKGNSVEEALYDQFLAKLVNILDLVENARDILHTNIEDILWNELSSLFSEHTFSELDSLSSHTIANEADDIKVSIDSTDPESVYFSGTGSVSCDLQHGSNADCARGDGLEWSDSFPFSFSGRASTKDLSAIEVNPDDISIDTSSYYE